MRGKRRKAMSITFKMYLPVIIISVITIISMIIAKIVTDDDWVLGIFFVGALLFATVFSITLTKNKDALSKVTNGLEKVTLVYDYASDDDYDIIIPDESNYEYIYRDDLGTFYLVKCEDASLPGIKYSREKITSKKENGVIKGELAVKDCSCKTADTDKNELNSDVPLGEITQ